MLDANAIYHTGFFVTDLEAAQRMFTDAIGVEWAPIHHYDPLRLWIPDKGWTEVRMRVSYSRPMPHQLELIEGGPAPSMILPARPMRAISGCGPTMSVARSAACLGSAGG
jgi:hypothetical protein